MDKSKRLFIKNALVGSIAFGYSKEIFAELMDFQRDTFDIMPIDKDRDRFKQDKITGDDPHIAHKVFWDKRSLNERLNGQTVEVEHHPIVIVGAGVAGLTAAFKLREYKPVVLEQASRLGGNAKGELWNKSPYALGAAYMVKPEVDSDIDRLLRDIQAYSMLKDSHIEPISFLDMNSKASLVGGTPEVSKGELEAWESLKNILTKYNMNEGYVFPDIPTDDKDMRSYVNTLDEVSFQDFLQQNMSKDLPLRVKIYLKQYFWSSFGADMSEVSAASGINFLASEMGDLLIGPGGNAWITECLARELLKTLKKDHLRVSSLVYSVKLLDDNKVKVSYLNKDGAPKIIICDKVVMACPKFVAKKVIDDLPSEKLEAINKIKYRSYVVGNALIKGGFKENFYEIYNLRKDSIDETKNRRPLVTDIVYGNFAQMSPTQTILSLYSPLPYDSGRAEIYSDMSLRKQERDMRQLLEVILPQMGLKIDSLQAIRMTRWGHPLPIASPGLMSGGVVDILRSPIKDRIYFAQQDNWALPAIETAMTEALSVSKIISLSMK